MATRKPIVLVSGLLSELPVGDFTVELAASPSGLIYVGSKLGIDGSAQISGNAGISAAVTAQASGNAALVVGTSALASGNAALTSASLKLPLAGGVLTGDVTLNTQSDLRFADSDSSNYIALQAPATITANVTMTLPAADGTNGQVLTTNGAGTLSFTTAASGASQWTTTGSDIYYTTGKVLVGTTTARSASAIAAKLQVEGLTADESSISLSRNTAQSFGSHLTFGKSRGATLNTSTIVQSGDDLGTINFAGADGTDLDSTAANIVCQVDGTPGANDMPGRLVFSTTADGSASPTERVRLDSSGRLLVGTSTARTNLYANTAAYTPPIQFEGNTNAWGNGVGILNYSAGGYGGTLALGLSLSNTRGTNTLVVNGETCGKFQFLANDGTNFYPIAEIQGLTDGATSAGDVPGRLAFSTTADGAASPTERMRITSTGQVRLAGAGITFNGDTAAANELDDYEEGTHLATLTPSTSGSITLNASYQTLTYTKVGRLVSIRGTLVASSSSSPVGYVSVSLPFTPALVSGLAYAGGSVFVDSATGVNANEFVLMITTGGARIYLGDATGLQSDSAQAIASAGQVYLEMNYHV